MSTRTVIEINHDYIHQLKKDPSHVAALLLMMSSGALGDPKAWNCDLGLPGVRVLGQRHHSETLKLEVS